MGPKPLPGTHHVVIVGGGFGGLYAAKALRKKPVTLTLLDRRNFHLFQPLLYTVAAGGLSPGDIAYPLRATLKNSPTTTVLQAEVVDFDPAQKRLILRDGELAYDSLIVATGLTYHYFGRDEWATVAPGLKSIEDALGMRRRILLAFEAAEREPDPEKQRAWLNFAIVGGGPTGVELAGTLGELAQHTLRDEFSHFDSRQAQITLIEGADRLLPTFPPELSARAQADLEKLGVSVRTSTLLTEIAGAHVTARESETGQEETWAARTVLWAAGVRVTPLAEVMARRTGAGTDRMGRLVVQPDLTLPGHPTIFVIGDMAHFAHQTGEPLPGVAQVAMQQGEYAARLVVRRLQGETLPPFTYRDKGTLAVIGRNKAVADLGRFHLGGFLAWLIWLFVHITYLIGFDNKILVLVQLGWNYLTRKRGARLITGPDPFPLVELPATDGAAGEAAAPANRANS